MSYTSAALPDRIESDCASPVLCGKRVGMVTFSPYPADPRPRRAVESLLKAGMTVDLICLADEENPNRQKSENLSIWRIPIQHRRAGKLSYAYQYSAFIVASASILALQSLRRRYDLAYVHNMPDVLVASTLVPKALGAKVVLDLHDPMPELMTTIFKLHPDSSSVRLIRTLEKWSIARADLVVTVNIACKRIFSARSCPAQKIGVVMNSPDHTIFGFQAARPMPHAHAMRRDRFALMYHGSLVERNGLDLAIDALARVRDRVPAAELRIYGRKTPFLDLMMKKAEHLGLKEAVQYLGPRSLEALVGEISACDLGIVPNQRNDFTDINTPTRIFEYLALGKPVIAPRTRGIQDYFAPDSLIFFEPGNADDLAAKIEQVFCHPAHTADTVMRGQAVYGAHAWPQERQTFLDLISQTLDRSHCA
ncbi:MAG: glycosyltransferase family 4 protein [Bryobacteraceae bacterium]